jgi:tetratricopeptide (TPR) repeat protein
MTSQMRPLELAVGLWADGKKREAVEQLVRLAQQLEDKNSLGRASAIYSFLLIQVGANTADDFERLRERDAFPDLDFLAKVFRGFFPAESPPAEFEDCQELGRVDPLLDECESNLEKGDWRKAGDAMLKAACSASQREVQWALARRALEFRPDSKQALEVFSRCGQSWDERAEFSYDYCANYLYPEVRRLLYEEGSPDWNHLGHYEQAIICCAQRASRFRCLDGERLQCATSIVDIFRKMKYLRTWKFLRLVKSKELAEHGWGHWLIGRILKGRQLIPESASHLKLAVRKMKGCERLVALVDLGSAQKDVAPFVEAAEIALQQTPELKANLLRDIVRRVLKIRTHEAYQAALSYSGELCESADPAFYSSREIGSCWGLRGQAFIGIKDDFRARVAFLKAAENFKRSSDLVWVHGQLAEATKLCGDHDQSVVHARKAMVHAQKEEKLAKLLRLGEAYADACNSRAAAYTYSQAKGHRDFDEVRMAQFYFEAGREKKIPEVLKGSKARNKAWIYYYLRELEMAEVSGLGSVSDLVQAERASLLIRKAIHHGLAERALARLTEPTRSLVRLRLQRDDLVLHPRTENYEIRQIRILPVVLVRKGRRQESARRLCQPFLEAVVDFHKREFGRWSAPPRIEEYQTFEVAGNIFAPRSESDWRSRMLELESELGIRSRTKNQVVLVFHVLPVRSNEFRGFAHNSSRVAHIWASNNRFVDKVTVHEFYHAILQMKHSHGFEAPDEPRCLMTQGARALKTCMLHPFQKALCLTPRWVQRRFQKGLRAVDDGRWTDAIEHFGAGFAEDPLHHSLSRYLAGVLYREDRFDEACEVLQRHFDHDPGREARADLIDALASSGRVEEAEKLQQGWPRGPDLCGHILHQARAWQAAGQYRRALKLLEDNLSRAKFHFRIYGAMAELRWLLQQRRAAHSAYLDAVERGYHGAEYYLCLIACERGEIGLARDYLEKARVDVPETALLFLELRLALKEGDWRQAKLKLASMPSKDLKSGWFKAYKVVFSFLDGKSELKTLKELEKYERGFEWCWLAKVWRSILEGHPNVGLLKTGIKLYPNNPCWRLARYLVDRTKVPRPFFHASILERALIENRSRPDDR